MDIIIHRHFLSVMIEVYLSPTRKKSVALFSTSFLFQHYKKTTLFFYAAKQSLTLSLPASSPALLLTNHSLGEFLRQVLQIHEE